MPRDNNGSDGISEKQFDKIMQQIPKQLRPVDVSKLMASIIYAYDMIEETPAILSYTVILLREVGMTVDPDTGKTSLDKVQIH